MTDSPKILSLFDNVNSETSQESSQAAPADRVGLQAIGDGPLKQLMDRNFLHYAAYVIRDRAIPDLDDGLKPVQRRILYSLHENDDGKFIKVANIVGYSMQFHPHGDASIGDALVSLANRLYFIERQGNFGNLITGDPPAAARYIECRLTELARAEIFNDDLTEFVPSYDGRKKEPVTLPARLPLLLMLGAEGIAVGISTRILPHNFPELVNAQIAILNKQPFSVFPDFPQGGLMDARAYNDGQGHVLMRALIEKKGENILAIHEIPAGTTTDTLIASIEDAARKGKIRIKSINDFTAGKVEIEIIISPDEDPDRATEALFAFTQCQIQIPSRIVVIRDNKPVEMDVPDILRHNTSKLVTILRKDLQRKRRRLVEDIHRKTLVRLFIENRIYKKLEPCTSPAEAQQAVREGLQPFLDSLQHDVTHDDVNSLLEIPIRRISLFDVEKNRKEIEQSQRDLGEVELDLSGIVPYAVRYLRGLLRKYGAAYPRRTRITTFGEISERELTADKLAIHYDRGKGYLGHKISGEQLMTCSPLDRLLLIWKDGRCKVVPPPEKLFVDHNLLYGAILDRELIVTIVYELDFFNYLKKFKVGKLVTNRESRIAPRGSSIRFFSTDNPVELYIRYVADERIKISQQIFSIEDQPVRGRDARGLVLTANRIEYIGANKVDDWDDILTGPPGKILDN
jgi:topoisomerase IV subunit A